MPKQQDLDRTETELDRQAREETKAGIGVPIEEVEAWIETWDTPNELPIPTPRKVR